jgi:parvulin-like peptidyl-prolyl isomerase
VVILAGSLMAFGQQPMGGLASSHASSLTKPASTAQSVTAPTNKPVAKVNGAVVTEVELRREMYTIFPYAQQHNGTFPKDLEPEIRKGALEMIIFEELVYQEAKRLNVIIPAEKLTRSEAAFRKQFQDKEQYNQFLKAECNGSQAVLREKIRRSLLIEKMLKTQVEQKSVITPLEVKAYYDKNVKKYTHGESFAIQTISIIPPENASKEIQQEAYDKIKDGLRLAKATKDYKGFGLLAEQISDDDWRTHLGDRKVMEANALPPEVVKALRAMKVNEISDIVKVDRAYVIVRLNARVPAGTTPFAEVKTKIQSDLQKQKTLATRSALNQKLRTTAKIEVL